MNVHKKARLVLTILALGSLVCLISGCTKDNKNSKTIGGALIGGGLGAGVGAAAASTGSKVAGAAAGGALGIIAGGLLGHALDQNDTTETSTTEKK